MVFVDLWTLCHCSKAPHLIQAHQRRHFALSTTPTATNMASLRPMARFVAPRARFAPSRIARVQPTRFASTTEQQVPTEQASEEVNLQPGEDVNMVRLSEY